MARVIEVTTPSGHRLKLEMLPTGREVISYDGRMMSDKWRPVWPGDHAFTVEEDGEEVEYTAKGYTAQGQTPTEHNFEWRFYRDGIEFLRAF